MDVRGAKNSHFKSLLTGGYHLSSVSRAQALFVRCNIFPGLRNLVTKASLSKALEHFRSLFSRDFQFVPETWDLPDQRKSLKKEFKPGKTYLMKPSQGMQGDGISLVQSFTEVEKILQHAPGKGFVCQEHVDNPCLLDGYKFDLRIFVAIDSLKPFRALLFEDGIARFATQKYQAPDASNIAVNTMHLTNFSLNKSHAHFKPPPKMKPRWSRDSDDDSDNSNSSESGDPDIDDCSSKRSITTILKQLRADGHIINTNRFWNSIQQVVSKTLMSMWPELWSSYATYFPTETLEDSPYNYPKPVFSFNRTPSHCFHIMGFDILLDSKLRPWLLEVNASPSFGVDAELDLRIKQSVIERMFDKLGVCKKTGTQSSDKKVDPVKEFAEFGSHSFGIKKRDHIDFCSLKFREFDPVSQWPQMALFQAPIFMFLFQRFSASTFAGMSSARLKRCLTWCRLFCKGLSQADVELVFIKTTRRYRLRTLTFVTFCKLLLRVARIRFVHVSAVDAVSLLREYLITTTIENIKAENSNKRGKRGDTETRASLRKARVSERDQRMAYRLKEMERIRSRQL